MNAIILVGGGGHCSSVIDTIRGQDEYTIVGILDQQDKVGGSINGIPIVGSDDDLPKYYQQGITQAFITIGSIGTPALRRSVQEKVAAAGYVTPSIIDVTAILSPSAVIGEGVFIGKGVILNANVTIGNHTIVNTGAIIEHDSHIGAWCHIAPGSVLSGEVHIGAGTHIGTNSTVIQHIRIGHESVIGAGSVVVNHIGSYVKAYGNPCREVERLADE